MQLPGSPPGTTPMVTQHRPSLPRRPRDLAPAWLDMPYGINLNDPKDSKLIEPYGVARDSLNPDMPESMPRPEEPQNQPIHELLRIDR